MKWFQKNIKRNGNDRKTIPLGWRRLDWQGASSLEAFIRPFSRYTKYNLEFQGSIQNLQKRALFMKFYPEMPWNNTEMR